MSDHSKFNFNFDKQVTVQSQGQKKIEKEPSWHSQFSLQIENPPMYTLPAHNVWLAPPIHRK